MASMTSLPLAQLIGSPKQIAWAGAVRQQMLASDALTTAASIEAELAAESGSADDARALVGDARVDELVRAARDEALAGEASAKWFIAHRDGPPSDLKDWIAARVWAAMR